MAKAATQGEATKKSRARRPTGESITVYLGTGHLTVTVQGGPLTMSEQDLALVQGIRQLLAAHQELLRAAADGPATKSASRPHDDVSRPGSSFPADEGGPVGEP